MKLGTIALLLLCAHSALAYEYTLQFKRPGAYGLVVAGYEFNGKTVVGNCSYYTETTSSGRGAHTVITNHYNTCTWDLYGNLISLTPELKPLIAPVVLAHTGTEVIYAESSIAKTGHDTRGFGFVNTRSAHYSWETPSGAHEVIPDDPYTVTATVLSDGDLPLILNKETVSTAITSLLTTSAGTANIHSSTCKSSLPVGSKCSVSVSYNPKTIGCTASPAGYAYTILGLSLITDAGDSPEFTQGFTITGIPVCDDN